MSDLSQLNITPNEFWTLVTNAFQLEYTLNNIDLIINLEGYYTSFYSDRSMN